MGKIDFYDAKEKVIHEIKRSDKAEVAHEWQAKFYIWLLELNSIAGARAVLEYPKLRQTSEVTLSIPDKTYLQEVIYKISGLLESETCPAVINSKICNSCSYYDFCYIEEAI